MLRCLYTGGPCSQKALADYCEVDPSSICRTLDTLEKAGFLIRRPSRTDRRAGEVSLTPKGIRAFETWEGQCMILEKKMLEGIEPGELEICIRVLNRMSRNLSCGEQDCRAQGFHGREFPKEVRSFPENDNK